MNEFFSPVYSMLPLHIPPQTAVMLFSLLSIVYLWFNICKSKTSGVEKKNIKAENLQHKGIEDSFPHVNVITCRKKLRKTFPFILLLVCKKNHMLIIRNGNRETIKVQNYLYV